MEIAIIGAGMGGLTTGIALKSSDIGSQSMSRQNRFYLSVLQFPCGQTG